MSRFLRLLTALLTIATLCTPQDRKGKKPKTQDAILEDVSIRREGDILLLDGKIKNTSQRTMMGIVLHFEFFAPNAKSLTIQKGPVDEPIVEPGQESEFRLQVKAPGTAVHVKVEAQDRDHRDLNLAKNGPFVIEQ